VPKTSSSPGRPPGRPRGSIKQHAVVNPLSLVPDTNSAIDEHKIRTLRKAISMGNSFSSACALAEVDYDLCRRWMALGGYPLSGHSTKDSVSVEEAEEPYKSFAQVMRTAAAEAEDRAVQQVMSAGNRDWRASAWWLEKRNPDDWATQKEASVKVASTGGIQIFLPDNGREKEHEIIEAKGIVTRELES
jgi:hypothetical protein